MARQYGKTRSSNNSGRSRRPPAESMEIYLPAVTFGRAVQAAAEFGITVDELVAEATLEHLKRMASELFEREFRAEQEEAARAMKPQVYRMEYAASWRSPSWSKGGGPASR